MHGPCKPLTMDGDFSRGALYGSPSIHLRMGERELNFSIDDLLVSFACGHNYNFCAGFVVGWWLVLATFMAAYI